MCFDDVRVVRVSKGDPCMPEAYKCPGLCMRQTDMLRIRCLWLTLCSAFLFSGCSSSIAGSWTTSEVRPQGAVFPINQVTFDAQGKYTATGEYSAQGTYSGEMHTTTGAYTRQQQTVRVSPVGGSPLEYKTRRRLDGKLVMTLKVPGQDGEVTAVLTPAAP